MRLAVFSDIHGNLTAFNAMLGDLANCGDFDQIWCLGDLAALGGQPHACVARLLELRDQYGKDALKIIGGNSDRYLATGARMAAAPPSEEAQFAGWRASMLKSNAVLAWNLERLSWDDFELLRDVLGRELRLTVEGYGQVIGFHAIPGDDESAALRPDSPDEEANDALLDREGRLALCGHTHHAMDRQIGRWRVINPGSVGMSFGNPGVAEWAILDWRDGALSVDLRRVPYDVDAALDAWEAQGYPELQWVRPRLTGQG